MWWKNNEMKTKPIKKFKINFVNDISNRKGALIIVYSERKTLGKKKKKRQCIMKKRHRAGPGTSKGNQQRMKKTGPNTHIYI
jgi:hypothetical protein